MFRKIEYNKFDLVLRELVFFFSSVLFVLILSTYTLADEINLNDELITNKASTFLIRVTGSSMIEEHIYDGDVLIVDKSLQVKHNSVAILNHHGQLVVKKIGRKNNKFFLISKFGNQNNFVEITEDNETQVWGIVTYVIHKVKK